MVLCLGVLLAAAALSAARAHGGGEGARGASPPVPFVLVVAPSASEAGPFLRQLDPAEAPGGRASGAWAVHHGSVAGTRVRGVVADSSKASMGACVGAELERATPSCVIVLGVSGALCDELDPADVVVSRRVGYHDVGAYRSGELSRIDMWYEVDARFSGTAERVCRLLSSGLLPDGRGGASRAVHGVILTGDSFVACSETRARLADRFGGHAVDVSTAAAGEVCDRYGVPFIAVRGVSDRADEHAASTLSRRWDRAAQHASVTARLIIESLPKELLSIPAE